MSRRRASADVNSQPQPHLPSLMALMEAKVSHGNKQALRHRRGETCGGEDVDEEMEIWWKDFLPFSVAERKENDC